MYLHLCEPDKHPACSMAAAGFSAYRDVTMGLQSRNVHRSANTAAATSSTAPEPRKFRGNERATSGMLPEARLPPRAAEDVANKRGQLTLGARLHFSGDVMVSAAETSRARVSTGGALLNPDSIEPSRYRRRSCCRQGKWGPPHWLRTTSRSHQRQKFTCPQRHNLHGGDNPVANIASYNPWGINATYRSKIDLTRLTSTSYRRKPDPVAQQGTRSLPQIAIDQLGPRAQLPRSYLFPVYFFFQPNPKLYAFSSHTSHSSGATSSTQRSRWGTEENPM